MHGTSKKSEEVEAELEKVLSKRFLSESELSERWNVSKKTLQKYRYNGTGPVFHRLGGNIRYAMSDILSFEEISRKSNVCAETVDRNGT